MLARFVLLMLALSTPTAFAQTAQTAPKPEPTAQQLRMKQCNADAKTQALKGEPRQQFMRNCLKKKPAR